MKSTIITSLLLLGIMSSAFAETYPYEYGGVNYTITFNNMSNLYVTNIDPVPSTENFVFPEGFKGLNTTVLQNSTTKNIGLSTITTIKGNSFNGNKFIETIDGDIVSTIEQSCFEGCTSLTTVNMPKASSIASSAFSGCTSLTKISFPEISSIGPNAFSNCIALNTIYLGGLSGVESDAFADCNFATSKPAISVKCENTDENKTTLTTIFGVSKWAYDSEKGVMYADYSVPVTTYNVTIDSNIANGSVESDVASAVEGAIVTVTAKPATGYELVEISVVTTSSESVQVADDGTFVMPASDVTITALFSSNTVTPICGNVGEANNEVVASGNKIVASGNGTLSVYNILGKQVYSAQVSGREMVTLAKGVYIVKFADKTTKIVLK
ncbi:MAG: T9SS type A sorting domain-containing protein [Bacteroidales bacterium]|jgi:hypothetical protein|nr:T9SS type A sorting domain-containing protein [Bacteroidales bacterium]